MTRRGVALLLAIATISSLGMIALAGYTLARGESAAGLAALARIQARAAAESAAETAMLGWAPERTPALPGEETELVRITGPGPAEGVARLRALGGPLYVIVGEGSSRGGGGQLLGAVRLEVLVLLDPPGPDSLTHPRRYPRGRRLLP